MIRLPLLRSGRPYASLAEATLSDLRTGEEVARVSQADAGLLSRDLARQGERREALSAVSAHELVAICRRAARLFSEADLPAGEGTQSPADYLVLLASTGGLPETLGRANLEKVRFVLAEMETVLAGLTRGLDLEALDRGWTLEDDRCVALKRRGDGLAVVLPSNSPGVHGVWIPAVPLKAPLYLKPGAREPWTPYRIAHALLAAGCPPEALGLYPTDHAGAAQLLVGAERSMLFGDAAAVRPWRDDPRVELHGPGASKVLLAADVPWEEHLDLLVTSVAANGGRSCTNASGVWTAGGGRELAAALALRLAAIEPLPLDHPAAALAAMEGGAARALSAHVDRLLAVPGARDLTAPLRGDRLALLDGWTFLRPTVVWCEDRRHPLVEWELPFPFVTVVEASEGEMLEEIGPSLVVTVLGGGEGFLRSLLASPLLERLNLGAVPTTEVRWDQPHEGNLFEHLYRQRALQGPVLASQGVPGALGSSRR